MATSTVIAGYSAASLATKFGGGNFAGQRYGTGRQIESLATGLGTASLQIAAIEYAGTPPNPLPEVDISTASIALPTMVETSNALLRAHDRSLAVVANLAGTLNGDTQQVYSTGTETISNFVTTNTSYDIRLNGAMSLAGTAVSLTFGGGTTTLTDMAHLEFGVVITGGNLLRSVNGTIDLDARFSTITAGGVFAALNGTAAGPLGNLAVHLTNLPTNVPLTLAITLTAYSVNTIGSGRSAISYGFDLNAPAGGSYDPRAVYRFFSTSDGTQFLTASADERDQLVAARPDLVLEGVGLYQILGTDNDPAAAPVYRFFDTRNGTHFFTGSAIERDGLIANRPDLAFEPSSTFLEHLVPQAGDTPVYRFFDSNHGTHFYTNDAGERAGVIASRPDLVPEGIAFYTPPGT